MKLDLVQGEDWEGLYVDGVLYDEGHEVSVWTILRALKINAGHHVPDQAWLEDRGDLPEKLSEVKIEAKP